MNELLKSMLIGLIPALVVSVATSWLTVRLSLRQFYSQRWWEKKAEAYSQIMEQLSYLHYFYGEWLDRDLGLRSLSGAEGLGLRTRETKARESITRATAIGSYIVSDSTGAALTKLIDGFNETEGNPDVGATLLKRYELVQECLATVRGDARKALART